MGAEPGPAARAGDTGRDGAEAGNTATRPLRVAVDARLEDGRAGGVQQYVLGLAAALCELDDGDESYEFLGEPGQQAWLTPYLSGDWRFIPPLAAGAPPPSGAAAIRRAVGQRLPIARTAWRRLARRGRPEPVVVATSDGTLEASGVDVVHFAFQGAFRTAVPSVYQPWDLQHVHLPEFFSDVQRRWRDAAYGAFCEQAALVVVASEWARGDVATHLGVPREKIAVVDVPPVVRAYPVPDAAAIEATRTALDLPARFAYYPAQAWPHKNHIRLLEAIARLRDRDGIRVDLVCSGGQNEHFAEVERVMRRLGLQDQVRFIGFVEPIAVQALYRLARLMVFPSLFEGWGLPIVEAFAVGLPVACSNVTSLPDLVGDAALTFDPLDVDAMATAIGSLWEDDARCATLAERGRRVVDRFDWGETARTLRAHYRSIGGRPLDEADRARIARSLGPNGR